MKRQAEEMESESSSVDFDPASPMSQSSGPTHKSPLQHLAGANRALKKRTLDQVIFNLNSGLSPERPTSTPSPNHMVPSPGADDIVPSPTPDPDSSTMESPLKGKAAALLYATDTSIPTINGQRPFPCVWLGDQSPKSADNNDIPAVPLTRPADTPQEVASNDEDAADENASVEICPQCNKVFKRKVYLQRHMEREHWSTAKVFKCDDCAYETKHQSNLSVHRRIHTGERPYHCGNCGQRYTQGHLLKSHIRSRHAGNMEFYNLDKKSDSTRGRKSLDAKHDPNTPSRNEKINSLLQQANLNAANQHKSQVTNGFFPPTMSQFMNNMNYLNSIRPLMANPLGLAAGNMFCNPRMFGLGGLQNGLAANALLSMPNSLPLMGHNGLSMTSSPSENGLKVPVKVTELPPSPDKEAKQEKSESHTEETTVPQDLTLKKEDVSGLDSITEKNKYVADYLKNNSSPKTDSERMTDSPMDLNLKNGSATPDHRDYLHNGVGCEADCCPHASKLKELRKNIVRMLSVLTPDILNIESGLDYSTDQVDQLLHEVIYSNDDEKKT